MENSDTSMDGYTLDDPIQKMTTIDELEINEHDQRHERTISSSSSEQLIPKEKQTGRGEDHLTKDFSILCFRNVLQSIRQFRCTSSCRTVSL